MGGKRFLVSSSRAQPRDLFRLPFAVFLRKSICMKHRDPQSHEAYGVSRSPLPSQLLPDRERKRFLASARNDDAGKAAFSLLPLEGGGAAMEVGFALFFLRPTPCPSGISLPREGGRWATHPASPSFLWKEVPRRGRDWLLLWIEKEWAGSVSSFRHPERSRGIFFVCRLLFSFVNPSA